MNSITNRHVNIDLFPSQDGFHFQHEGQEHVLPSMNKIHEFFQKQPFDTVKFYHEGKKSYVHFGPDDVEAFDSKRVLRKELSYESGGAWVEEKEGRKRYFVDDSGWFNTSYKRVSKEEFLQRLESPSTMQKVLGIGLGILALLPGALEIKERFSFGTKETGMSLLALQQKNPLLGILGCSLLLSVVDAQAMGLEFQVNNYTTSFQRNPAIAPLSDGGFVITWDSNFQDGDSGGIFGQRYDNRGALVGPEFQVNNHSIGTQLNPAIAALPGGGFVVTWDSEGQDGNLIGIFGQRYDGSGAINGPEFQVNNHTISSQISSAISPMSDGGFVVVWQSFGQDGDQHGIFGQRYGSSGAINGLEFQVNNYTLNSQINSAIAPLADGGFVITWESNDQDGSANGIFGRRYNSGGAPVSSEFQVSNFTSMDQQNPAIASLSDGGFVITWESASQDGSSFGIFGQRYISSGAPIGSEFQVNNYTTNSQFDPALASLSDGGFVVIWASFVQDGSNFGIFGQRYGSSGAPIDSEFQVNNYTTNEQTDPAIAALSDGGFVITWESNNQDGDNYGIFGQRYDWSGNAVPLTYLPSIDPSLLSSLSSNAGTSNSPSSEASIIRSSTASSSMQSSFLGPPSSSVSSNQSTDLSMLNSQMSLTSSSSAENSEQSSSSVSNIPTSSTTTLLTSNAPTSSSEFVIPADVDIIYGEIYSIRQSGQVIGTYTISGGSGQLDGTIPNVLTVQLDPNYVPEEGDTLTLFSFAEGQGSFLDNLIVEGVDSECLEARPESSGNGLEFQIIFEGARSCTTIAPKMLASAFPILIN